MCVLYSTGLSRSSSRLRNAPHTPGLVSCTGHSLSYTSMPSAGALTADVSEFEYTCGAATLYYTPTHYQHMPSTWSHMGVACACAGSRTGDEVLMCFHAVSDDIRKSADHPVPFKRLVEFERVGPLAAGTSSASVTFSVPVSRFGLVTNSGDTKVYPGVHTLIVSRGFGREVNATIALK
eukprot:m.1075677 g.1075677  ORF g.1075677 m.1075677 type:complete len:179 (+) comp24243_c0_seq4:230-766(+)